LAKSEGLQDRVSFERVDAHELRYPDESFDAAVSCTVLEEGNADQMLRELVRVTRPGGRVVVVTRAMDVAWCVNIPVPKDLRAKLNLAGPSTGGGVGAAGCADCSLYARAVRAGLEPVSVGPQFAVYRQGERLDEVLTRLITTLSGEEAATCRDAVTLAAREGTIFVAEPFHYIIGRKGNAVSRA
jgi:SAM-dependent methyltransferase